MQVLPGWNGRLWCNVLSPSDRGGQERGERHRQEQPVHRDVLVEVLQRKVDLPQTRPDRFSAAEELRLLTTFEFLCLG